MDYSTEIKNGEKLYSDGNINQAKTIFQSVLAKQPSNHMALNNLGVIYFSRSEIDSAERFFIKAVEAKNDYVDALLNLAELYRKSRRSELAIKYLDKCSEVVENYHQCNVIGKIYIESGKNQKAVAILEKSITFNPLQNNIKEVLKSLFQKNIKDSGIKTEKPSSVNSNSRLIIIADSLMDWSARLAILSARLLANYSGEIIMIGESMHPFFDKEMGVEFYTWESATKNVKLDSPWGQFRKPQYKPFLINKFYKGTTIYLDSDIFCAKPFDEIININGKWGAVITRKDRNIINQEYLNLWNLKFPVNTQINSGVLVFRDQSIIKEWCNIFKEASHDFKKYDYLMNKQPWTYDQIGLIIAAARMNLPPIQFDNKNNYEVAFHGWSNINNANIVHLTNWKVLSFAEAKEMDKRWYANKDFIKCAKEVESIARRETAIPPIFPLPNPIRSKKGVSLVRSGYTTRKILLGLSQGIGNVVMGTPLIKALLNMDFSIDLLSGQFNNKSEQVLEGLGANIVNFDEAKKKSHSYMLGLQSVWPVRGIEELCGQVVYAGEILKYWDNYLFIHEVEANMALAYALGYEDEIPSLYCHRETKNTIQGINREKPTIGLHISKNYSNQFYANRALKLPERIAGLLNDADFRLVLIGGKGSEPNLSLYPKGTIDLVGKLELSQTANVIKSIDAMINEDSGIMHVCAAMGTPQVAIFGPTSVVKNRPWSNVACVLQSNLPCQPCQFTPMMDTCNKNNCMDINYEEAVRIVTKLYRTFSVKNNNDFFFNYAFFDDDKDYTQIWKRTVETAGKAYNIEYRQYSYDIVKRLIPPKSTVFDYACGLGEISKQLYFDKHCDVYGCDANEFAIKHVNSLIPGNRFYVGDSIKKQNKKFDFIILSHILEHIKKPAEIIKYIKNYAENIIIVLPNNFEKQKEHKNMAWSNLSEFEKIIPDAKKVDAEYPHELPNAFKNPIYLIKHCHLDISYKYCETSYPTDNYLHP